MQYTDYVHFFFLQWRFFHIKQSNLKIWLSSDPLKFYQLFYIHIFILSIYHYA